jgi:polygalacturonase
MGAKIFGLVVLLMSIGVVDASGTPPPGDLPYYDVNVFGATGDGVTNDRAAIQRAIDSCAVRGGTVLFPPGRYLTGSLLLRSHVDLHLGAGATLLGSTKLADYEEHVPALRSYNDLFLKHSLLYAEGKSDITIRGEGTIDGQGAAFKVTTREKPDRYMNRPFVIRLVSCTNVRVEGVTLTNSAMWMQQYLACENLSIHRIRVYNHANKNNDMMDIDGCRNVVVSDCIGDTDDDGITLKSTSPYVTENVSITNCILSSHCNAFKTGTESTGGFRNITISNIVVKPSQAPNVMTGHAGGISGFILASVDGGVLEGIVVSNIRIEGPQVPFAIRLGNRARKHSPDATPPPVSTVRDITIRGVSADRVGSMGCSITGIPGSPVERISISDVRMAFRGGGTREDANRTMGEMQDSYPEATMWGNLPAYGFTIRHARDIAFSGIDLYYRGQEERPAFLAEDVSGLRISSFEASVDTSAPALFALRNVTDGTIAHSRAKGRTDTFLSVRGAARPAVVLMNNILLGVRRIVDGDVDSGVVLEGNIR